MQRLGKLQYIHSGSGYGKLKRYLVAVDVDGVKLESIDLDNTEVKRVHLAAVNLWSVDRMAIELQDVDLRAVNQLGGITEWEMGNIDSNRNEGILKVSVY